METLAYLHLALAHEAPADTDYTVSISAWENSKLFVRFNQQKLSTSVACSLLSLTVTLSLLGMAHQALAVVQEGDRGSQVTVLQQRLQQLGYFKSTVTGYFGSLTKEAVIQFQQAKGLLADGVVGKNTETLLGEPVKSNVQPVKQPVKEPSNGVWRLGDRGQQISAIQESLAVAGFSGGSSGIFDQATQEAVRRFQQAKGLTADGIVGPQTMAALPAIGGSAPLPASGRLTSRLDTNWTDIRTTSRINVRAIQSRLQSQGFYSGPIDGLWGPKTQAAVEAAQRAYRVSADDLKNGGF